MIDRSASAKPSAKQRTTLIAGCLLLGVLGGTLLTLFIGLLKIHINYGFFTSPDLASIPNHPGMPHEPVTFSIYYIIWLALCLVLSGLLMAYLYLRLRFQWRTNASLMREQDHLRTQTALIVQENQNLENRIAQDHWQADFSALLQTSLESAPLDDMLDRLVDQLVGISWLGLAPRWAVLLPSLPSRRFRIRRSRNCDSGDLQPSAQLAPADESGDFHFKPPVPERRPLCTGGRREYYLCLADDSDDLSGVLVLYTHSDDALSQPAADFLQSTANVLVGVLQRKLMEENLRQERDKVKHYLALAGVFFMILDANGFIRWLNRKACEILEGEDSELLGRNWLTTFIPVSRRAEMEKLMHRLLQGETASVDRFECQLLTYRRQDRILSLYLNAFVDEENTPTILASAEDITDRAMTDKALWETVIRYRQIFEDSPVAIGEADLSDLRAHLNRLPIQPDIDINLFLQSHPEILLECQDLIHLADVNKAALILTQAPTKEALLSGFFHLFTPESLEIFRHFIVAVAENRTAFETEAVIKSFNGETLHVMIRMTALMDVKNVWTKALITLVDMTQRKLMEETIRTNFARYSRFFEDSPISLWEEDQTELVQRLAQLSLTGSGGMRKYLNDSPAVLMELLPLIRITDVNQTAVQLFRARDKQDFLLRWAYIFLDGTLEVFKEQVLSVAEGRKNFESEIIYRSFDGEKIHAVFRSCIISTPDQRRRISLVSILDITERKRTEFALQNAHTRMERLFTALPSVLISIDDKGLIGHWNPAAEQVFGIPAQAVLGKPIFESGIQWDWNDFSTRLGLIEGQIIPRTISDFRYTRPDGKDGFIDLTFTPLVHENESSSELLLVGTDTTERKILQDQLLQSQKIESIGRLAAGIAHEINTPTQYVGDNIRFFQEAYADLEGLLKQYARLREAAGSCSLSRDLFQAIEEAENKFDLAYLSEEIPKAIQQSLEGVQRVTSIVRAMKDFAHPDSSEKTMVNLNQAIASTITVARNEWKYVADLVTDFDPDLPLVPCLPGEFNQVILNMIINAAHAISDVVDGGAKGKGTITVATRHDAKSAEIRISDTGTGIPQQIISRIFDPFFTTKKVGRGTGQGLAISRNVIVDKHQGTIDVQTEIRKGTAFIIHLPL